MGSDEHIQSLKKEVTRWIIAKPILLTQIPTIVSLPLAERDKCIKSIALQKDPVSQRNAIEAFVDILFNDDISENKLSQIIKCIGLSKLIKIEFPANYFSHPGLKYGVNYFTHRGVEYMNIMGSNIMENSNPAINKARLSIINSVLDWVYINYDPVQDKPLTLVSMMSSFLFIEHFIHQALLEMAVSDDRIQWRCIEPWHGSDSKTHQSSLELWNDAQQTFIKGKKNKVIFFSTEKDYLDKQIHAHNSSNSDKGQGPVVILSFVNCYYGNSMHSVGNFQKEDMLIGTIIKEGDLKEANSICYVNTFGNSEENKIQLREKYKPGRCMFIIKTMIKGWIDFDDTPKIAFGSIYKGHDETIHEFVLAILQDFHRNPPETPPLKKLRNAFKNVCAMINPSESCLFITFPCFDYFIGLNSLYQFFNAGTHPSEFPVILCEILNNEVTVTDKHDRSEVKGATGC